MLFLPRYLCAFVQVATCADIDMHDIDTTIPAIEYTTIPANKGAEGAVSVRERAVNEAALCVSLMCLMVCLCEVVFRGCSAPASLVFLSLLSFSVSIYAHGGFQGVVAGRAYATSALDAGLG